MNKILIAITVVSLLAAGFFGYKSSNPEQFQAATGFRNATSTEKIDIITKYLDKTGLIIFDKHKATFENEVAGLYKTVPGRKYAILTLKQDIYKVRSSLLGNTKLPFSTQFVPSEYTCGFNNMIWTEIYNCILILNKVNPITQSGIDFYISLSDNDATKLLNAQENYNYNFFAKFYEFSDQLGAKYSTYPKKP
jgi:hypothetical protein